MSGKKFFTGLLSLSLIFTGCGASSEPEIIMPDKTVKTAELLLPTEDTVRYRWRFWWKRGRKCPKQPKYRYI